MADMPMPGGAPAVTESPDALVSEIQEKMSTLAEMLPEEQRARLEALMGELAGLGGGEPGEAEEAEPDMMSAMGGKGMPVGPHMKG